MRIVLITIILAVTNLAALNLSLEESIDLALKNNLQLQANEQNISIADQTYSEVRSSLLPQISFNGGYQISRTDLPSSYLPDKLDITSMLSNSADDDDKLLAGILENSVNAMIPTQISEESNYVGSIKLDQVVYLGGKLLNGIKVAGIYRQFERNRYELAKKDLIFATTDLYYKVLLLKEVVDINKEALSLAQKHFARVSELNKQGIVSEFDLIRAELEVLKLEPELKSAENNYALIVDSFRKQLGLDAVEIELIDKLSLSEKVDFTLEESIVKAKQNRLEIKLLEASRDMYEIQWKAEKGNFLPNVALSAEYSAFSQKNEFTVKPADFGTSYQVMLGFQLPIFKGFGNVAKRVKTKAEFRKADLEYRDLHDKIELDVRNAFQHLSYTRKQYETGQKRVELANKGMIIANARYENQIGINLEVLDAQLEQKIAQLSYLQAVYEITIAQKRLEKAMGM